MDDISTGASGDIQHATATARSMVTRYGMSEKLGTVLYGSEHSNDAVFLGRDFSSGKNYSEKTAAEIDDEIRSLIDKAYTKCRDILTEHRDRLEFVAEYLLKHETMDADQFKAAMETPGITHEDLDKIAEDKKKNSEEENKKRAEKLREEEEARRESEVSNTPENNDENGRDPNNLPF